MYIVTLYKATFFSRKPVRTEKFTTKEDAWQFYKQMKLDNPGEVVTLRHAGVPCREHIYLGVYVVYLVYIL